MQTGMIKALSVLKSIANDMKVSIEYADLDGVSYIDGDRILIARNLEHDDAAVREAAKCLVRWMLGGYEEMATLPDDDPEHMKYERNISRIGGAMILAILRGIHQTAKDVDDMMDNPFGKLRVNGLKISPGLGQYLTPQEINLINNIISCAAKRRKDK